jgi:hypothetical protein
LFLYRVSSKQPAYPASARRTLENKDMAHGNPDQPIVLTIGDVSFDWLCFAIDSDQKKKASAPIVEPSPHEPLAWSQGSRVEYPVVHGGAWYVDSYIRMLLGPEDRNCIFTYRRFNPAAMRVVESGVLLHSFTEYSRFEGSFRDKGPTTHEFKDADEDRVYRAGHNPRFNGPPNGQLRHPKVEPRSDLAEEDQGDHIGAKQTSTDSFFANLNKPRPFPAENPRIVVVFDCGNGFSSLDFARVGGPRPSGPAIASKDSTAERSEANWSQALSQREESLGTRACCHLGSRERQASTRKPRGAGGRRRTPRVNGSEVRAPTLAVPGRQRLFAAHRRRR